MLGNYIRSFLTSQFGHIIENFDDSKIKFSAWTGGQILLENLYVKREVLDTWGPSPVEVRFGRIGRLELRIPWKSFRLQSTSIVLSDVSVLIAPKQSNDAPEHEQRQQGEIPQDAKEVKVQHLLEAQVLKRSVSPQKKATRLERLLSWLSSALISNLTVTVQNVHLRYEDTGTSFGFVWNDSAPSTASFAVGLTLRQFSVQRQLPRQQDRGGGRSETHACKLAAAYQLAIYWDRKCQLAVRLCEPETRGGRSLIRAAMDHCLDGQDSSRQHSYILRPVSPSLNFSPGSSDVDDHDDGGSSSAVELVIPQCDFAVHRHVLEDASYLQRSLAVWQHSQRLIMNRELLVDLAKLRPKCPVCDDKRGWWRYAGGATMLLLKNARKRRRLGWSSFAKAIIIRSQYIDLYLRIWRDDGVEDAHSLLLQLENELSAEEIALYRMTAFEAILGKLHSRKEIRDRTARGNDRTRNAFVNLGDQSPELRRRAAFDIVSVLLDQSESQLEGRTSQRATPCPCDVWEISLSCPSASFQVLDASPRSSVSVLKLSFGFLQNQTLKSDGSWELDAKVASLSIVDMTAGGNKPSYPTLLGPKATNDDNAARVVIDGESLPCCASVSIHRKFHGASGMRGSTTKTCVRLAPLEAVYSTRPIAKVTSVMSAGRSTEVLDDYQRLAALVSNWRSRQQGRLLRALAHKRKRIIVDIDVAAPILRVPQQQGATARVLVVRLGRIQIFSADTAREVLTRFDDKWRLVCSDISVLSGESSTADSQGFVQLQEMHQTVEPFTLDVSILTSIASDRDHVSMVSVDAMIPRLSCNIRSSVLSLVKDLGHQWSEASRTGVRHTSPPVRAFVASGAPSNLRIVQFQLAAPLLVVQLSDDMCVCQSGLDAYSQRKSTVPLVIFALRDSHMNGKHENRVDGSVALTLSTRMGSFEVFDLYQQLWDNARVCLSSFAPPDHTDPMQWRERLDRQPSDGSGEGDTMSLTITHTQLAGSCTDESAVALQFRQLFVEWNPETLCAFVKVLGHSPVLGTAKEKTGRVVEVTTSDDHDVFFDAYESHSSDNGSEVMKDVAYFVDATDGLGVEPEHEELWLSFSSRLGMGVQVGDNFEADTPIEQNRSEHSSGRTSVKIEVERFHINFNKDTRRSRLFIAEMKKMQFQYSTREGGGSSIAVDMEHFTVSDPASLESKSLYSHIMETTVRGGEVGSCDTPPFQLTLQLNPRKPRFDSGRDDSKDPTCSAAMDPRTGKIHGCDYYVDLQLTPVRFVFIQQLWLEIADYFFEAIIGSSVWGKGEPASGKVASVNDSDAIEPMGQSFTLFSVRMATPTVIMPVSYRSTDFLRVNFRSIEMSNHYSLTLGSTGGREGSAFNHLFNNCRVCLEDMQVLSWDGESICVFPPHEGRPIGEDSIIEVSVRWPTGSVVARVVPKWRVSCDIDRVNLLLRRNDYVLFLHVISYNIGEPVRTHETDQSVADETDQRTRGSVVVYGYEKKGAPPSTYSVVVNVGNLAVLLRDSAACTHAAPSSQATLQASCQRFKWTLRKMRDRISEQNLKCQVDLAYVKARNEPQNLLSVLSGKHTTQSPPIVTYASRTNQDGDNIKSVELSGASICAVHRSWRWMYDFFGGIGAPELLSVEDVKNLVQVGDKWYRIASRTTGGGNLSRSQTRTPAHIPSFHVRMILSSSQIVVSGKKPGPSLVVRLDQVDYLHVNDGRICRSLFVNDAELCVCNDSLNTKPLLRPWSCFGKFERCDWRANGDCSLHEAALYTNTLRGSVCYTDLCCLIDVLAETSKEIDEVRSHQRPNRVHNEGEVDSLAGVKAPNESCIPDKALGICFLEGVHVTLVDDSMRHFGTSQDLVALEVAELLVHQRSVKEALKRAQTTVTHTILSYAALHDCLQPESSPFRLAMECGHDTRASNGEDRPKMTRTNFETKLSPLWGFERTPTFHDWVDVLKKEVCPGFLEGNAGKSAVEFSHASGSGSFRGYELHSDTIALQWNPSTVIAMQRFLGRLKKRVSQLPTYSQHNGAAEGSSKEDNVRVHNEQRLDASIQIGRFHISLNKEHQERQLMTLALLDVRMKLSKDEDGFGVEGSVRDVQALDNDDYSGRLRRAMNRENRQILSVVREGQGLDGSDVEFFRFQYQTYPNGLLAATVPVWVKSRISEDREKRIDDYLKLSVASVRLVYLRERTEEILDYLSNGLPGKGMGATSRAAKGFIDKRIQTRSFLDVNVHSPQIEIPRNELLHHGILVRLGDFTTMSWFADVLDKKDHLKAEVCRFLDLSIDGLGWQVFGGPSQNSKESPPVDVRFQLRKPVRTQGATTVKGSMSFVDLFLRYSDYALLRAVAAENLCKPIDDERWDNVEKAFSIGEEALRQTEAPAHQVVYSPNARFVRYGTRSQDRSGMSPTVDGVAGSSPPDTTEARGSSSASERAVVSFEFDMKGVMMTLHRDDDLDMNGSFGDDFMSHFNYDMVLLRMSDIKTHFVRKMSGNSSFNLTLHDLSLFDLGDVPRLAREQYKQNLLSISSIQAGRKAKRANRYPCAFAMIAEGYNPSGGASESNDMEPQLLLTVDSCPSTSVGFVRDANTQDLDKVTVARIVLNCLTVNALIRPLREVASFFSRKWSAVAVDDATEPLSRPSAAVVARDRSKRDGARTSSLGIQLKLVAHYPRLYFVADESDVQSRALVLRGLAVCNFAYLLHSTSFDATGLFDNGGRRCTSGIIRDDDCVITLDANLHSLESYINPDVKALLGKSAEAAEMTSARESAQGGDDHALGVALIEPVTVGVQCSQSSKDRMPTMRSMSLDVESVSTMISFEDLTLIDAVVRRWSAGAGPPESAATDDFVTYDITFVTSRLGLLLKYFDGSVVVDAMEGTATSLPVCRGDVLIAINGVPVTGEPLNEVASHLDRLPRPVSLRFTRKTMTADGGHVQVLEKEDLVEKNTEGQLEYQLHFKLGRPNGIKFKNGIVWDMPMVTGMDVTSFLDALYVEDGDSPTFRLPCAGTVISRVSGLESAELGFEETARLLHEFSIPPPAEEAVAIRSQCYSVGFLEVPASGWACTDHFDACVSGLSLTFIDDLRGRDMPLLRGKLSGMDVHVERGVGVETKKIKLPAPVTHRYSKMAPGGRHASTFDVMLSVTWSSRVNIDYYHPRVAVWEPLLEQSQFGMHLEWLPSASFKGVRRSGQLAIELVDHLFLKTQSGQSSKEPEYQVLVAINITDAAADVVSTLMRKYTEWGKDSMFSPVPSARNSYLDLTELAVSEAPLGKGLGEENQDNRLTNHPPASGITRVPYLKREAVRQAAQAALLFAQKRGAGTQRQRKSAKPFVFQNRSGMSLSFYHNPIDVRAGHEAQFVADGQDSLFSMEETPFESLGESTRFGKPYDKKVRSYDGNFPTITIAFESPEGTLVSPLENLGVVRVGCFRKGLRVEKQISDSSSAAVFKFRFLVPVMWEVQVEDNRRILTFSSGVQISPIAKEMAVDVGVSPVLDKKQKSTTIRQIGTATPENKCYLPVSLALRCEEMAIYLRPGGEGFNWGDVDVLRFQRAEAGETSDDSTGGQGPAVWKWVESFDGFCSSTCSPLSNSDRSIWLSCLTSRRGRKSSDDQNLSDHSAMVSVVVDSSLTLHNMLPMTVEWEIADLAFSTIDASLFRSQRLMLGGDGSVAERVLESGDCVEILSCNLSIVDALVRVRVRKDLQWTEWAHIAPPQDEKQAHECDEINVQVPGVLGCPLTIGMRVAPKLAYSSETKSESLCFGAEVFIYSEIWIRNLTNLPLSFGCKWNQLHAPSTERAPEVKVASADTASKAIAEAALLEMASVLEFGENGKGLRSSGQGEASTKDLHHLPLQEVQLVCWEVFEYVEIESSAVKRRWWATESFDCLRPDKDSIDIGTLGYWKDRTWLIDYSGETSAEGWESCRSLTTGEFSFSARRLFNPAHSFWRRRWWRRMSTKTNSPVFHGGIVAFHQSVDVCNWRGHTLAGHKGGMVSESTMASLSLSVRSGDGDWSQTMKLPRRGAASGILRVPASRWPKITAVLESPGLSSGTEQDSDASGRSTTLSASIYEICFTLADLPGEWGEFSREFVVSPRFLLRNDSTTMTFKVKQYGAADTTATRLFPGSVSPFYWADSRLPALACLLVCERDQYRWSGGFDVCNLGTTPVRVRQKLGSKGKFTSVKVAVELRPDGSSISISFKEEDESGGGAMFRVENQSPFNVWVTQDGVLANPSAVSREPGTVSSHNPPEIDGDIIRPKSQICFALDVPFRQGKYVGRKAATLSELLRVRVGLGPLSSRDGIESTHVVNLTFVGDRVLLNPEKLSVLRNLWTKLHPLRILGLVVTDGPTRVLKFVLVLRPSVSEPIGLPEDFALTGEYAVPSSSQHDGRPTLEEGRTAIAQLVKKSAVEALEMKQAQKVPNEEAAVKLASYIKLNESDSLLQSAADTHFWFRASVAGFVLSFVDSGPSEIAVMTLNDLLVVAEWNSQRTMDATALMTSSWLQVDNHLPNARFPVAVCPDEEEGAPAHQGSTETKPPFLAVALTFAPRHKSGILCLKSVTVAPRSLAVALDLAFVVRLQRFIFGLQDHFSFTSMDSSSRGVATSKTRIPFPELSDSADAFGAFGAESPQIYFEGFNVLPASINLSVAPAMALTPSQAALEGADNAAIHAAVRKGDLSMADRGMVGVKIGRKNRTAMAVLRGVFKSILVDAILNLDGASLNFSGVLLKNHLSSGQQLRTFLVAHYLASLRSNLPTLLGSLAALGNPLGLIRGIGDGVSDFVSEPVKGIRRTAQDLDPVHIVDGVARGTESLARHAVGGIADSASMLTETFSKNMAVLTLDRRYAQQRDLARRENQEELSFVGGVESGVTQLVRGVVEGVTGVVRAPLRGAERSGMQGFAKGVGKGLIGLFVKPMIGLSDAATDVMIGVRESVDGGRYHWRGGVYRISPVRPRRALHGRYRNLRPFSLADAMASSLMARTGLAGENYLSHLDLGDRVALFSVKKFVLLAADGRELLFLKLKHVKDARVDHSRGEDGAATHAVVIELHIPRKNGSPREVINCNESRSLADSLLQQFQLALSLVEINDRRLA